MKQSVLHRPVALLTTCVLAAMLSACQPNANSTSDTLPDNEQASSNPSKADSNFNEQSANTTIVDSDPTLSDELKEVIETANGDEFTHDAMNDMQKSYAKALANMQEEMALIGDINNVDVAFARGMLGHHRGAIDMTVLEKRYGNDTSLQTLAQTIRTTEKTEINALRKWLASHPDTRDVEPETLQARQDYQYAINAMFNKLKLAINSPNPDIAFAQAMLAQHRGAEAMAKIQLKHGQNDEMKKLADKIIAEQLKQIAALEAWLVEQGADPSPRLVPVDLDLDLESTNDDTNTSTDDTAMQDEELTPTDDSMNQ